MTRRGPESRLAPDQEELENHRVMLSCENVSDDRAQEEDIAFAIGEAAQVAFKSDSDEVGVKLPQPDPVWFR